MGTLIVRGGALDPQFKLDQRIWRAFFFNTVPAGLMMDGGNEGTARRRG